MTKKPTGIRRNTPKVLEVVRELAPDFGPPEDEWLLPTKRDWVAFSKSDVASVFDPVADGTAMRQLFELYDERRRINGSIDGPMTQGYKGQPVLNPLLRHRSEVDRQIMALEDRFGRNPRARIALGISVLEANKSLDQMNAQFRKEMEEDE